MYCNAFSEIIPGANYHIKVIAHLAN